MFLVPIKILKFSLKTKTTKLRVIKKFPDKSIDIATFQIAKIVQKCFQRIILKFVTVPR